MSAPVVLLYDDAAPVPTEVAAMTGVRSFGDLLRRRERLSGTVQRMARAAGMGDLLHAHSHEELGRFAQLARHQPDDHLYLVLPSHLAPTADERDAALFLRKLALFGEPVALWRHERPTPVCMLDRGGLLAYVAASGGEEERERFTQDHAARLPSVEDALGLADLREVAAALEFLSGSFSARHFNHVTQDRYHVIKRSSDVGKIQREYRHYRLLPESLQPYFLQPFDLRADAEGASYRTRRLFVPDVAVQWVHGVFSEAQFDQLLERLLHFIDERPRREVGREVVAERAHELYVAKTRRRVEELLALPAGRTVHATLEAGGVADGVRGLLERYVRLYERLSRGRRERTLCVSHGDLGFSNVLYSPSTQDFQLIDPRGAETEDELYSDVMYDVAKLSHSVLGGYDFIVAGLAELVHDERLRLGLRLEPAPPAALRARFADALERHGFDLRQVRLREAALFLSMLPLHIDALPRVTAFAVVARDIMDELEGGTE